MLSLSRRGGRGARPLERRRSSEHAAGDVLYLIPLLEKLEEALQARDLLELVHDCYQHVPTRVRLDVLGYEDIYTY